MSFRTYQNRRTHLLSLIEKGHPGNATILAKIVGVSRSTFYEYLLEFRLGGISIEYDKSEKKYKKKRIQSDVIGQLADIFAKQSKN